MRCDLCKKQLTPADIPGYTDMARLQSLKPKLYFRCQICRLELPEHKDVEVIEALKLIDDLIGRGAVVWIKFSCHHCKSRQTVDKENSFFTEGITCEACSRVTVPAKIGWIVSLGK